MIKLTHTQFAATVCSLFALLSIWGVYHHEIWLDEAYHYLLPRDSHNLAELYAGSSTSGHPFLWPLLLYGYKFVFPGVLAMQLLHTFFAVICVYVIARYSPFKRWQIICICFGYYFFYEYNLIAKNYMLGIMLVFVAVMLFQQRRSLWSIGIVLVLAANCHFFTMVLAASLMLYVLMEWKGRGRIAVGLFFLAGALISIFHSVPPKPHLHTFASYDSSPLISSVRVVRAASLPAKGLFNVPDYRGPRSWNSNLFANISQVIVLVLSAVSFLLSFLSFRKNPRICFLFFLPVFGIMGIVYLMPLGVGTRYWGYAYLSLLIAFWMLLRKQPILLPLQRYYLGGVIVIQLLAGIISFGIDIVRPFSCARLTAAYVREHGLDHLPVFHELLATGPSYSAYSGKPIFYPASGTFETYGFVQSTAWPDSVNFLSQCRESLRSLHQPKALLVMNKDIAIANYRIPEGIEIKPIVNFQHSIMSSENSYLYYISLTDAPSNR